MSSLARSEPPPLPFRAKSLSSNDGAVHRAYLTPLPAMKLRNPLREAGRRRGAEIFDRCMRRRGATDVEVAEALETNKRTIERWRDARDGIQVGDLLVLDRRLALAVLQALTEELLTSDFHGE